jgi:hypothetical protein
VTTGPSATHRIACFNPPLADEAIHGHPSRPGHVPAPAPAGELDELASHAALADGAVTTEHLLASEARDDEPSGSRPHEQPEDGA